MRSRIRFWWATVPMFGTVALIADERGKRLVGWGHAFWRDPETGSRFRGFRVPLTTSVLVVGFSRDKKYVPVTQDEEAAIARAFALVR